MSLPPENYKKHKILQHRCIKVNYKSFCVECHENFAKRETQVIPHVDVYLGQKVGHGGLHHHSICHLKRKVDFKKSSAWAPRQ